MIGETQPWLQSIQLFWRCRVASASTHHAARLCCASTSVRRAELHETSADRILCRGSFDGVRVLSSDQDNVDEDWPSNDLHPPDTEVLTQLIDACASLRDVDALIVQHGQQLSPFAAARLALKVEGLLSTSRAAAPPKLVRIVPVLTSNVPSMSIVGLMHVLSLCLALPPSAAFSSLLDITLLHLTPTSAAKSHLYLRHLIHLFLSSSTLALRSSTDPKVSVPKALLQGLAKYAATEAVSTLSSAPTRDAVLAAKILASFRHRKKVPLGSLRPILTALATHTERSLLEYNATQLIIVLSCLRVCGGVPKSLYRAVSSALLAGRLGHLSVRHQVTILHVFDSAAQKLPEALRQSFVSSSLSDISLLSNPDDVAKLAQATAATSNMTPTVAMPIAEYMVRNAASVAPAVTAGCLGALLSLGCVHGGAIAAFKGAAVPRLGECQAWQLIEAAFCAAHPSCAEEWPQVRAASIAKGAGAEIATTAKYMEALLKFAGADCQRTSDAARALTVLLNGATIASVSSRATRGFGSSTSEMSELVSGPLHSLMAALEHTKDVSDGEGAVTSSEGEEEPASSEGSELASPKGSQASLLGSSETAELLSAIQKHLQGSRARGVAARNARNAQPLSAEQLQNAKPAQVVQAATAWELGVTSDTGESQQQTGEGAAQQPGGTGEGFMALAQERVATATPAEVLQYLSGFTQQGLQTPGGSALCAVVLTRLRNLLPLAHRSSTKGNRNGSRHRNSHSAADKAPAWSLQVAEGVLTVLLDRFMWIDDADAVAVADLATSLVATAASNHVGLTSQNIDSASRIVRACAKFAQKMRRGSATWKESGAVWREESGVLEAVMKTGRVAAHALTAAQQRMVPLQAYAAVASFASVAADAGSGAAVAADVSLRSWATGPAACSALRAVGSSAATAGSSTAAADMRAAALLLNSAAPAGPALRTAAAAACTAAASAAPLGALAGLSNALRYSGFTRQRECEELTLACTTLERELILRASAETAAPAASILFCLVCMGRMLSPAQAASLANTLKPTFASLRPHPAVRLLWALGRCGHADSNLLHTLSSKVKELQSKVTASRRFSEGSQSTVTPFAPDDPTELSQNSDTRDTVPMDTSTRTDSQSGIEDTEDLDGGMGDTVASGSLKAQHEQTYESALLLLSSADRHAAATLAAGIPWALASCGASYPQGLASSAATRAANLVISIPYLMERVPLLHVSSFLWGMAVVRPPAAREAVRRAFRVLVAAVPSTAHDAYLPGAPLSSGAASAVPRRRNMKHKFAHASEFSGGGGASGSAAAERLFSAKTVELSALEPLDWVNVLYAAARFKFRNTWLLRKALMELTAHDCAAVRQLSTSRLTDLADALGNLRLYSVTLTGALTHRFTALLAAPTTFVNPRVDPHNVATWLFMYASLRHYDATLLDAVSAYAARHPAARFRSLSALSTALWAHARLGTHPSRFLDLCQLSAAEVLPVAQPGTKISFQVQCNVVRIAWSLAVLKEWEHPLFRMALDTLSIAQRTDPIMKKRALETSPSVHPTTDDVPALDLDSESCGSGVGAEAGLDPMQELNAYGNSQRTDHDSTRSDNREATFRGATGQDRIAPLRSLPPYSALQLVQCMLLASAAGKTDLLAMLPEHLRVSCGGAWKRAVERQCRERQDDDGAPLPLGLVEGTISSTLTSLGCQFSLNVKTPDGLLRLDCLLHHHLLDGPPGMNLVALDIWNEDHVAQNCRHVLARGVIRRRIAAARGVHLVPILWQEWRRVISDTNARSALMLSRLRSAGLHLPTQHEQPTDSTDNADWQK